MAGQADAGETPRKPGKLRWVLGWIVLPGTLIAALFLTGVHLGARDPNRPVARLLLKVFGRTAGVAEPASPTVASKSFKGPRPGAEPGLPGRYSTYLTHERLELISNQTMIPIAELECEDLCWAAHDKLLVYRVDQCAFARAPRMLPSELVCLVTLEKTSAPDSAQPE